MNKLQKEGQEFQSNLKTVEELLLRRFNFQVIEQLKYNQGDTRLINVKDILTQKEYTILIFLLFDDKNKISSKKLAEAQKRSQILSECKNSYIMKFYDSFQINEYFFVQLEKFGLTINKWCQIYQEFLLYKILVSKIALQVLNLLDYLQSKNLSAQILTDGAVFINDMHEIKIWNIQKQFDSQENSEITKQSQSLVLCDVLDFRRFISSILEKQQYFDYYEPFLQQKLQQNLLQNIQGKQMLDLKGQIQLLAQQYNSILSKQLSMLNVDKIYQLVKSFTQYDINTQKKKFMKDVLIICNLKNPDQIEHTYLACQLLLKQKNYLDAIQVIKNNIKSFENYQLLIEQQIISHLYWENYNLFLNLQSKKPKRRRIDIDLEDISSNPIWDSQSNSLKQNENICNLKFERVESVQKKMEQIFQNKNKKIYISNINIFKINFGGMNTQEDTNQFFNFLSQQYLAIGLTQQALSVQKQVLNFDPKNTIQTNYLSKLFELNFDFKNQIKCLQFIYKNQKQHSILEKIIDSLMKLNLYEMAKQVCLFLTSFDENNNSALLNLGLIYLQQQNFKKAKQVFETYINLNNSNPKAYLYLSICSFKKEHYFWSIQNLLVYYKKERKIPFYKNIIKMNHAIISKSLKQAYFVYQSQIMSLKNSHNQARFLYLYKENKIDLCENTHNEIYLRGIRSEMMLSDTNQQIDNQQNDQKKKGDSEQGQQNQTKNSSETIQKEVLINSFQQNNEFETKSIEIQTNQINSKIQKQEVHLDQCDLLKYTYSKNQQEGFKENIQSQNNSLNQQLVQSNLNEDQKKQNCQSKKNCQNLKQIDDETASQQQKSLEKNIEGSNQNNQSLARQDLLNDQFSSEINLENKEMDYENTVKNTNQNDIQEENKSEKIVSKGNLDQINELTSNYSNDNMNENDYNQNIQSQNFYEEIQIQENSNNNSFESFQDIQIQDNQSFTNDPCNLENELFQDLDINSFVTLFSADYSSESTESGTKIHVGDVERIF